MIRQRVGELLVRAGLKLLGLEKIAEEAARELEREEIDDSPEEGPRGPSYPPQGAGIDVDAAIRGRIDPELNDIPDLNALDLDSEDFTSLGPIVSEEGMRMRASGESSTPQELEPVALPGSIEARMQDYVGKLKLRT